MDTPLIEHNNEGTAKVVTGILYYPPERNLRYPAHSWCTPEQPIWTKTDKPILAVSDVRGALRGLGFVPRDIDYDLEFLRGTEWIPEKTASDHDVLAYMHTNNAAAEHTLTVRFTLTVRLISYGSRRTVRDQDGSQYELYDNDRECVIS
jgi:hypothetical protein